MNVYLHAANERRPPLRLVVRFAIMAILGALAGWAVRTNMVLRTNNQGQGGGGGSYTRAGGESGAAALNTTINYRDHFRFDPRTPGLNFAGTISALLQSSVPVLLNGSNLEFPGLPDALPVDIAGGGFEDGMMFWITPGHPSLTRTASLDITNDENSGGALSQGARRGINTRKGARLPLSTTTPSYLAYIDSNGLSELTSHGADAKPPLQPSPYDTTTGFPAQYAHRLIPEPSPAMLAALGFVVLLCRFHAQRAT